jgi:hypothetical protein
MDTAAAVGIKQGADRPADDPFLVIHPTGPAAVAHQSLQHICPFSVSPLRGNQFGNEQRLREEHRYVQHAAVGTPPAARHCPAATEIFRLCGAKSQSLRQRRFDATFSKRASQQGSQFVAKQLKIHQCHNDLS